MKVTPHQIFVVVMTAVTVVVLAGCGLVILAMT